MNPMKAAKTTTNPVAFSVRDLRNQAFEKHLEVIVLEAQLWRARLAYNDLLRRAADVVERRS
jgi:hypothetical protein